VMWMRQWLIILEVPRGTGGWGLFGHMRNENCVCFGYLCCQVFELDREIQDYKEKIELYRAKLQEIVSNCTAMGNRLLC
jgi:hypothetical protein